MLPCRHAHARAQSQQHQPEHRRHFVVIQCPHRLIAADDGQSGGERIRFAEDRIRDRDCEIGDGVGVDDVAEVENTGHLPVRNEHVVVVRVVVHCRAAQAREARGIVCLDPTRQTADECAHRGIFDERQELADERQTCREVPIEIAMNRWVIESLQCLIEPGNRASDIFQELRRMILHGAKRHAVDPREHADEMTDARARRDFRDRRAGQCGYDTRTEIDPPGGMVERRVLCLEQRAAVHRTGDLRTTRRPAAVCSRTF